MEIQCLQYNYELLISNETASNNIKLYIYVILINWMFVFSTFITVLILIQRNIVRSKDIIVNLIYRFLG